jgi:hypothetical protein
MIYTDHMYIRYNNNEHHNNYYVVILILKSVSHIRIPSSTLLPFAIYESLLN